jgi:hypothetical protein
MTRTYSEKGVDYRQPAKCLPSDTRTHSML